MPRHCDDWLDGLQSGAMTRLRAWPVVLFIAQVGCASRQIPAPVPAEVMTLAPDERLGVDDVFETRVFLEGDLTGLYRIAGDGMVDYPLIGRIKVVGMTSGEVQAMITEKLKDGFIKNPQVTVTVHEWNSRKVSVLGQVLKPGAVVYFSNMTIIDAIAAAGGFTGIAAKNKVTLRREDKGSVVSRSYPVADISEGRAPNVAIFPGDVLVVDERMF